MSKSPRPSIYNIAAHGGFADALAKGLIDRFGKDRLGLARGFVILPNNRARVAVQEAFVRLSENGLLLPQMAVIGDLDLDESIGVALDSGALSLDIPPAVDPFDRLLTLARMIGDLSNKRDAPLTPKEALRLAREFARTLDQLTIEELSLKSLLDLDVEPELSRHWQDSLFFFREVASAWQEKLVKWGKVDEAARRNALFNRISDHWKNDPPRHFVVAAGITTSAPAIARFLRTIAFLPDGMVVFPDLDLIMPDEEWDQLGPFKPDPATGFAPYGQETHPQYHMKILLGRMSIARAEVARWPRTGESGAIAARSRALSNAFAIPKLTGRWQSLDSRERSLAGVRLVEARNSAEEAQIVALQAREALEQPRQRIAIITPDRDLARRISAHLARWDISVDDTAGHPLAKTPEGVFFLNLVAAVTEKFPPAQLLDLLKHPLVFAGERRVEWLDKVRGLDLLLRGPRPAPGLSGIEALLRQENKRTQKLRAELRPWWDGVQALLKPAADRVAANGKWSTVLEQFQQLAEQLTNGQIWAREAGRQLADLLSELMARIDLGPKTIAASDISGYFEDLLLNISVRPAYGGHPRIQLFGLLEARLQQADLVICAGLNEGSWPQSLPVDPWLAPMIRKKLGLPAQERQIGLSAHDLVGAMGAKNVVLTRAQRDGSGPAIASRFLLRMRAMCGDNLKVDKVALQYARQIDRPDSLQSEDQPAPTPSLAQRDVPISVTHVNKLTADPYAFYAAHILRLQSLDAIDADPSAAWRGSLVHDILEHWAEDDDYDPAALVKRAQAVLADQTAHPVMRNLWAPRLIAGLQWVAAQYSEEKSAGRKALATERKGEAQIADVKLFGIADRIDQLPDGSLAIVDYKTGNPPSNAEVKAGFSLQLGLLAAIAEQSSFGDISGPVSKFEYWSLSKKNDAFGHLNTPTNPRSQNPIAADEMVDHAVAHFTAAVQKYIKGDAPMIAKLHPEFAPYADYDQLMRFEEWYGRSADPSEGTANE